MEVNRKIFEIYKTIKKTKDFVFESDILNEAPNFSPPLSKMVVSSSFGPRWGKTHDGVDLGAVSEPVKSVADGVVTFTATDYGPCGGTIQISHDGGYSSVYCHMKRIDVEKNQKVKQGEVIGISGGGENDPGRGRSLGPHLHLSIRKDGEPINPIDVIGKEGVVFDTALVSTNSDIIDSNSETEDTGYIPGSSSENLDFINTKLPSSVEDLQFLQKLSDKNVKENISKIKKLL